VFRSASYPFIVRKTSDWLAHGKNLLTPSPRLFCRYSPVCNVYDKKNPAVASILWVFYMSKGLDFFDTVFIIFRRKWVQLSTLHVYHHFSIFLVSPRLVCCRLFMLNRRLG
jgi:hypothetical protein